MEAADVVEAEVAVAASADVVEAAEATRVYWTILVLDASRL